jgi:transcriptional regulator with XRE-family HTH domain
MENIGTELKKLLKKHKVSVYKITEDLGIAHESLYRSLKNGANPEWKRIKQILDYLGYDLKFIKRKEAKLGESKPSKKGRWEEWQNVRRRSTRESTK